LARVKRTRQLMTSRRFHDTQLCLQPCLALGGHSDFWPQTLEIKTFSLSSFHYSFCLFVGCQGILILYFHGVRSSDAVVVWKGWYSRCCPCCLCGKGEKKSAQKPKRTSAKSSILGRSELIESLPTAPNTSTTSNGSPLTTSKHGPALGPLKASPQTHDSGSKVKGIVLLPLSKETSPSMDRDDEDMVDFI